MKADKKYTYEWFMSLGYEEWARSLPWIQDQVLANYAAKLLTDAQVKNIWHHHEEVVQKKVDDANKKNPPKIVQKETATPDKPIGSATAPDTRPFYQKLWDAQQHVLNFLDPTNLGEKAGEAAQPVIQAIKNSFNITGYVIIGVVILLVVNIFKK